MLKFKFLFLIASFFLFWLSSNAQELNVTVEINSQQVQNVDKKIFATLRTAIMEFMNNTKWSTETYGNIEKVEATLLITIKKSLSQTEFEATCQVESRRPINR